jgi:hypothetical protein
MKTKSELLIPCFCAIAIAMIVWSGTFGIRNQFTYASLLGGDTVSDQNNIGKLLVNETSDGQTIEQGNIPQTEVQQEENPEKQLSAKDRTEETIPKSQSDIVMQDLKDTALVNRIFPLILKKLDSAALLKIVDGKQLLEKLDGKQLLEKVLPYLEVKPIVTHIEGESVSKVKAPTLGSAVFAMRASCPEGTAVSGGYNLDSGATAVSDELKGETYQVIVSQESSFEYSNSHAAIECLNLEVGVKQ